MPSSAHKKCRLLHYCRIPEESATRGVFCGIYLSTYDAAPMRMIT